MRRKIFLLLCVLVFFPSVASAAVSFDPTHEPLFIEYTIKVGDVIEADIYKAYKHAAGDWQLNDVIIDSLYKKQGRMVMSVTVDERHLASTQYIKITSGAEYINFHNAIYWVKVNGVTIWTAEDGNLFEPPEPVLSVGVNEGDTEVYLYWTPPAKPVSKYRVYKDGELIYETPQTYYTVRELQNDVRYRFCVSAVNKLGLESTQKCVYATPHNPDVTPPPVPFDLQGTGSHEMVRLTWKYEHVGDFSHFYVYRDGVRIGGKIFFPAYTDREVENDVTYTYYVTAVDKSGNESEPSNTVEVTPYDDRPPPIPPPDPNDITDPDLREIGKGMFDVFDSAKTAGLLIVIAAILLGVIFIVARWLWRLLKRWFAKSGSFGRR